MDHEIERPRGRDIGEDRIERLFDAEQRHGGNEEDDVEDQDDVTDLEEVTAPADDQRRDFGAVEDGAATDRETDAAANENAAEERRQQEIGRDIREVQGRERDGEAANREQRCGWRTRRPIWL